MTPPVQPELLSPKELESLTAKEKLHYDEVRIKYAANMPPILDLMKKTHDELWLLTRINNHRAFGPHPGIVIDGDSGNGKTTLVTDFGRKYDLDQREIHEPSSMSDGFEFVPIVYLNCDSTPTPKGFNQRFLEFFGISPKYASTGEMTSLALKLVHECQTSLIIVDEIHNLNLHRDSHREVNNHLKQFANDADATFVYAGVGLEKRKFMLEGRTDEDEERLSQISRRFKRIPAEPLSPFGDDRKLLNGILAVYERQLPLANAKEGDLVSMAPYLWDRTQGVIGSISGLVTEAYARAIILGTERITKALVQGMTIAQGAELAHARLEGNRKKAA